jgi:hypothetical protein
MSLLQRKLSPFFSATLTHPRMRGARGRLAELGRRARGAPHRVLYFHQVDDPYGHLVAQVLGKGGEPDFCTWGQDRGWLFEEISRRRAPCGPAMEGEGER